MLYIEEVFFLKKLIITEKPRVALKIAVNGRKFLGDFFLNNILLTKDYLEKNEKLLSKIIKKIGYIENQNYIISFAEGHLITLNSAKDYNPNYKNWRNIPFPYIPNPFQTKIISGKEFLYNTIKKIMNSDNISEIINACDGDREGSYIFHLIYNHAKCKKPVKRLWVESHTEESLLKAFKNMEDATLPKYINLRKAGCCRSKSDWIMGALLTAKATIELSQKDIITVGRVQTAVLAEIVRVELLNRNFKSKKFYHIVAKFKTEKNEIYEGIYNEEDYESLDEVNNVIKLLKKEGQIINYDVKKENQYSPPLHDQTSLAVEMSKSLNISPDETLKASQSLYEKGYVTYPRTASRYITQSDVNDFEKMLHSISNINSLALTYKFNKNNERIVNDSKVESHIAIIPTVEIPGIISKLNNYEKLIYTAIIKRTIAVNFPPSVDEKQIIVTNVAGLNFKSTGIKELKRGWREIYDIKEKNNSIPKVNKGDIVQVLSFEPKEVITQPPKRYTEATILKFMESCGKKIKNEEMRELMKNKGIGTSATRAEILNKLKKIEYIELKGKSIYPTDKGINIIKIFPVDELKNAEFTGEMEQWLYQVEKGELSEEEYMNKIIELYKLSCNKLNNKKQNIFKNEVNENIGICPLCKSPIKKCKGKYGIFYSCTGYRNGCKFTIGTIAGKTLSEFQVKMLLEKGQTKEIKGFKKKNGGTFSAKLKLEKGKIRFIFEK